MSEGRVQRRLAAVLAADVVGYSGLVAADETGTLERLNSLRASVIDPLFTKHNGRLVKEMGDGLLVEFASVVDAVQCALTLQKELADLNRAIPEDRRITFRIGINLGDVIAERGDIFGDGVNIAARLETMAEPGGICISAAAEQQVRGKVSAEFEDLGPKMLKNMAEPVQVFRIHSIGSKRPPTRLPSHGNRRLIVGISFVAALAVLIAVAVLFPRTNPVQLLDKSVAVLPLATNEAEQEWFADGVSEDIITDLSKISGLFVIARNSSFPYRHSKKDTATIGRELGVKYLLEGSVRRSGNRLRVSAQLVDTVTGSYVWAERFDESDENVFSLQARVARGVANALEVEVSDNEEKALAQKQETKPAAYETFISGREHFLRQTPEDFAKAKDFYEKAIAIDPGYGRAHAALAQVYNRSFELGWSRSALGVGWDVARVRAGNYLDKAWENPTALTHRVASDIYLRTRRTAEALAQAEKALELEPNESENLMSVATAQIFSGQVEDALDLIDRAIRANPRFPAEYLYLEGLAHFTAGRFEEAANELEETLERNPALYRTHGLLAATYAALGRDTEAQRHYESFIDAAPINSVYGKGTREFFLLHWPYNNPEDVNRILMLLQTAIGQEIPSAHSTDRTP